jgi:hypothetical protein
MTKDRREKFKLLAAAETSPQAARASEQGDEIREMLILTCPRSWRGGLAFQRLSLPPCECEQL